jgi:hypothetical protein
MPCNHVKLPNGATAIVCSRNRPKRCTECGAPGTILCDYPDTSNKSGTCDRPCCRKHAVNVGPDKDYCVGHAVYCLAHARERA